MANDPRAVPSVPELADLDPAFDLSTFATERSYKADEPARATPAAAGGAALELQDLPRFGELPWRDDTIVSPGAPEAATPWLTESRIQLAVAGLLGIGGIAIMLLAFRGSGAPPPLSPASTRPPVETPAAQLPANDAAEPSDRQAATAPTPAAAPTDQPPAAVAPRRDPAHAKPARAPAQPPSRARASGTRDPTPTATAGRSAPTSKTPGSASRVAAATAPVRPWVAAATIEHSTMNVNALPWANVWIDGRSVGETPLANIRLPVGDHEVIFRHPELGERRVRAIVEAGVPARVTVDLRR